MFQDFFIHAFKKFYIAIWFCTLIEDFMEVLTLLLPHNFIRQFVFIWGHEQCSMTLGQFIARTYYCFKDLSCVGESMKKWAIHAKVKPFSKHCIFQMVVFYWFILHFSHNFKNWISNLRPNLTCNMVETQCFWHQALHYS